MTLANKAILSGADDHPPMLEKGMYNSWKIRMELYMMNRPHGRVILASAKKGPLYSNSQEIERATSVATNARQSKEKLHEKQLDKEEFQETGSMDAFRVLKTQCRLDFLKEDLVYQSLRKSLSLCLSFLDS
nr:hypothetical protein [Tanacetum cinerariifolium]